MENEQNSSSSESQMKSSSSSVSLQYFEKDKQEICEENVTRPNNPTELVLNFRAKHEIYPGTSEDEEETSEKLSAVVEQSESPSQNTESSKSLEVQDGNEINDVLQDRVNSLKRAMAQLRDQLKTEVSLWRKEKEELNLLRDRCETIALEEATAAARAAAAAYAAESPLSDELGDMVDISSEQALKELAILEYEKELAKYQDAYSFAQADARYNARRHLMAKAYEQKIVEVERLCNEELEKIQQNADNLKPLKEIASQWHTSAYDRGDLPKDEDVRNKSQKLAVSRVFEREYLEFSNVDAEVNVISEIFVGKYKSRESARQQSV